MSRPVSKTLMATIVFGLFAIFANSEGNGDTTAEAVQARALMSGMILAIKFYQVEYNRLPKVDSEAADEHISLPAMSTLLKELSGEEFKINPRRITFLDPPKAKDHRSGVERDEHGASALLDPWGQPFYMVMDLNGDGQVPNPDTRDNKANPFLKAPVIMYSSGPDRDPKTWDDNVLSWK